MVIRSRCQPLGGCKGGSIPVEYRGTSSSLVRGISIARAPRLRPTPEKKTGSLIITATFVLSEVDDGAGQAGREGEGANGGKGAASAAASAAAVPVLQLLHPVRLGPGIKHTWGTTSLRQHCSCECCGVTSEKADDHQGTPISENYASYSRTEL